MRTLNDLHEAFAALEAAAPTELTEPVTGPSRPRRVVSAISVTAVAAAVAAIAVMVPLAFDRQSQRDVPPVGVDPGLTNPIIAPSSLITLREFAFHVAEVPGFAPAYSWEVTPEGQTTFVRWVEHGYDVRVDIHYQGMYRDDRPASAQSVSVHGAAGYYAEGQMFGQPRTNARLVWEYAPGSWAEVQVSGLPADLEGFNEGSFMELPAETETRAALLGIAEAVGSGGPEARLPFRLAATPASLPSPDTAWRMSVAHQGGVQWSATLGLGDRDAAPSIWVTSGRNAYECDDGNPTDESATKETFTYRGYAGCLVKETYRGVIAVVLQVGVQQRSILMNLDVDAPPASLNQYPLEDLKRVLAELTVASDDDPDDWFALPTALGAD